LLTETLQKNKNEKKEGRSETPPLSTIQTHEHQKQSKIQNLTELQSSQN
jgi:hypothetical protein